MLTKVLTASMLILGLLTVSQQRPSAARRFEESERTEDIYYLPSPTWLNVFSLGHQEALADLLWCRSLVYFGEELGRQSPVKHVYRYIDSMISLDPYFERVYIWGPMAAMYRPGKKTREDMERAIEYARKGRELFPNSGKIAWELGAALAYELPPYLETDDEKKAARVEAAEHMQVAVRLGAGPAWAALSNASSLIKLGKKEQALKHLEEIYAQVSDPNVREEIGRRIQIYRSEAYAEAMQRTISDFRDKHIRDFPYISPTLFMLVGTRIDNRNDYIEATFGTDQK